MTTAVRDMFDDAHPDEDDLDELMGGSSTPAPAAVKAPPPARAKPPGARGPRAPTGGDEEELFGVGGGGNKRPNPAKAAPANLGKAPSSAPRV